MRMPLLALVLLPLVPAAPAEAAPFQMLTLAGNLYAPAEVHVAAGHTLELTNLDLQGHDVYASDVDESGQPLFRSAVLGTGQHGIVAGVETLTPERGPYPFTCSLHPEMFGNITVV